MSERDEAFYEKVFGETFALYNRQEMEEFIEPFRVRFDRNGIDPRAVFEGKRCLDAGCGNGRGSLFMLEHGAASVRAVDFSHKNVETATGWARSFGHDAFEASQGTLEDLPFDDEAFDFVWCNGVVMHTLHPNRCLAELARVLKTGGASWIYVYGSGGVYWRFAYHARELVSDIPVERCIDLLKLFRYETRYIAEYIDDWYATHLRAYTHADLSARLEELGFDPPRLLPMGMDYDTSHRRHHADSDLQRDIFGEGDLRYLLTKSQHAQANEHTLDEGVYGSNYPQPPSFSPLEGALAALNKDEIPSDARRVAAAAHIQRELRLMLGDAEPFDLGAFCELIGRVTQLAKA